MKLENWLNPDVLKNKNYHSQFSSAKPFLHLTLKDFFKISVAEKLILELKKEEFYLEDNDLYSFMRTFDLKRSNNSFIQEFLSVSFTRQILHSRL